MINLKMQKITKISLALFLVSLLVVPQFVSAQFGLEYGSALELGTQELRTSIMQVINVILSFLGIIALIIILWGGFMWMTAGGNEEKVTKARQMLVAGVVGLAIVLAAYAIANFVVNSLYGATGGE